jgi:kinesin family protein 6/9
VQHINGLKSRIEQRRVKRAMAAVADGDDPAALPSDPEEEALKREIDVHKGTYKDGFARLRDLKKEIEHLQMILEQSRLRLQVSGRALGRI